MIERRTFVVVVCDCCKDSYSGNDDFGFSVFDDNNGAWDSLECTEWIFDRSESGLCFCSPECKTKYNTPKSKALEIKTPSHNIEKSLIPLDVVEELILKWVGENGRREISHLLHEYVKKHPANK